jgi:hypothetical protein
LDPLEVAVNDLSQTIKSMQVESEYQIMREKTHRHSKSSCCICVDVMMSIASESTNERVVWWSVFEVFMVAAMSAFQIYYLRKIFEVKRPV